MGANSANYNHYLLNPMLLYIALFQEGLFLYYVFYMIRIGVRYLPVVIYSIDDKKEAMYYLFSSILVVYWH